LVVEALLVVVLSWLPDALSFMRQVAATCEETQHKNDNNGFGEV
jgi:hypothetical protein